MKIEFTTSWWEGIIIGILLVKAYQKTFIYIAIHWLNKESTKTNSVRKSLLSKMGYDSLVTMREAVEEEIQHRKG